MYWIRSLSTRPVKFRRLIRSRTFRPELAVLEDRVLLSVTSTIFSLDPMNSSLTLSGTINGHAISQQGAGSLTTSYHGTVAADWSLDPGSQSIRFNSTGSAATANNSGSWQPNVGGGGGSAPANYGATASFPFSICNVTARVAVRNLVAASSTPSPLALTPSGSDPYTFPSTQTLNITAGNADYSYSTNFCGSGSGTSNIGGNSAANMASSRGVYHDLGSGGYRIDIPISVTINQNISTPLGNIPVVLHIIGSLRANATLAVVDLTNGSVPGVYDYATHAVATQGAFHITDPVARVTDAGASTLTSMTVTLTNHPDGAQELLAADLTGTGLSGSYNSTTGVFTVTGNASPATYTTALERFTYADNSTNPTVGNRTITVAVSDGTNGSVLRTSTVNVSGPAVSFSVSGFPSPIAAGSPGTVTITARDAHGNVASGYAGTVTFTSSDGQASLPMNHTFTGTDNGVYTTSATLFTAGSQSLTATDTLTSSITGTQPGIIVNPAGLDHFAITSSVDGTGTIAGNAFNVTVSAQDAYNNIITGYTGTVAFSSADPFGAALPQSYMFTTGDAGTHTFAGQTTLFTAGTWDVTATDTAGGQSSSDFISVTAASATAFQVIAPASVAPGQVFDVTLVAVDPYGNTDVNYLGTVTWTTSDPDPGALVPGNYTFDRSDAGMVAFLGDTVLITSGMQSITATDTVSSVTGSATIAVGGTGPGFGLSRHTSTAPASAISLNDGQPTRYAEVRPALTREQRDECHSVAIDLVFTQMARHRQDLMMWGDFDIPWQPN